MDVPVVQTGQLVVAVCVDYSHKTPRMSREVQQKLAQQEAMRNLKGALCPHTTHYP